MDFIDDNETWKPIPEYGGRYEVSNFGRVKSNYIFVRTTKVIRERIFVGNITKGYRHVLLSSEHGLKKKNLKVHRLVSKAFISNPTNKPIVNHKDGNKLNNNVSNLEWCTHIENCNHSLKVLKRNCCEKAGLSKLNNIQVREIKSRLKSEAIGARLAEEFNVNKRTISAIKTGKTWQHL